MVPLVDHRRLQPPGTVYWLVWELLLAQATIILRTREGISTAKPIWDGVYCILISCINGCLFRCYELGKSQDFTELNAIGKFLLAKSNSTDEMVYPLAQKMHQLRLYSFMGNLSTSKTMLVPSHQLLFGKFVLIA